MKNKNKYFLVLEFHGAKLFKNRKQGQTSMDYEFRPTIEDEKLSREANKPLERGLLPYFREPITVYQISNVIHVLWGKRPVSFFCPKKSYSRDEDLFQKGKEGYLKISDIQEEIMTVRKSRNNSWNPAFIPNWHSVQKYAQEKFPQVKIILEKYLNLREIQRIPFKDIIPLIQKVPDKERIELGQEFMELKLANFTYTFGKYKNGKFENPVPSSIGTNLRGQMLVISSVNKVIILSGEILVPISDDDIEILNMMPNHAKLLDGGLVLIKEIVPIDHVTIDGFRKISDISDESIYPVKNERGKYEPIKRCNYAIKD